MALLLFVAPTLAYADGFEMFSKHEELKAHVIVDAGNVEELDPPSGTHSTGEVLQLGDKCFEPVSGVGRWGRGKKAGLLLVDRARSMKLALLESSIGSVNVNVISVIQIACPSASPIQRR